MVEFEVSQHYRPTSSAVLWVLAIVVVLIAGIFVWGYWINVGTLQIKGEFPFRIFAGAQDGFCSNEVDCRFDLSPGVYDVSLEKQGYYPQKRSVALLRGETALLSVGFELIPFLEPYEGDLDLEARGPLVEWGEVVSYGWREERAVYVKAREDGPAEQSEEAEVFLWNGKTSESVAFFDTLDHPSVFLGDRDVVLMEDGRIFVVDLVDKRRERILSGSSVGNEVAWDSGGTVFLVVYSDSGGVEKSGVWDTEFRKFRSIELGLRVGASVWNFSDPRVLLVVGDQFGAEPPDGVLDGGGLLLDAVASEREHYLYEVRFLISEESELVEVDKVVDFKRTGIVPVRLWWRGEALLVEDEEGTVWRVRL